MEAVLVAGPTATSTVETIACTHCTYPRRDGQAERALSDLENIEMVDPLPTKGRQSEY